MVKFLNSPTPDADVEEIMDRLNEYILFNNLDNISNSTFQPNKNEIIKKTSNNLVEVNRKYKVSIFNNIISTRKRFGKLECFIKKITRKLIRWYISDESAIKEVVMQVLQDT